LSKTELFEYKDFYSSLNSNNITESECKQYCEEAKKYKTRLDYLEQGTKIMLPIIDNLINMFAESKIDMLMNLSLSSAASQTKYAMCYENFDINEDYSTDVKTSFKLTKDYWASKVQNYFAQNKKASLKVPSQFPTHNVSDSDYEYFKEIFENSKCYLCKEGFNLRNKPTLDRINNALPHTKDNVKPCCCYCNKYKSETIYSAQEIRK
jgi:hypothetical protein